MAKIKNYFGKNSNGPMTKVADLYTYGKFGGLPIEEENTKNSYWNIWTEKNKEYKTEYQGDFNYTEMGYGHLYDGQVESIKYYVNSKVKSVWEVSYYLQNYYGEAPPGTTFGSKKYFNYTNKKTKKLFKKNDTLIGGKGSDNLWGYSGNDKISGGNGNDTLVGGKGNDKLIGGKGKDIFKLSNGKGYDLIQDFKNKQDKIFIGSMKKLKLKNKGKDVFVYSGKDLLAKVKKAKGLLSKKGKYLV